MAWIDVLNCILEAAIRTLRLLQCLNWLDALLYEVHKLAEVNKLVADNLIVSVESHTSTVALSHLEVASTLSQSTEHCTYLRTQADAIYAASLSYVRWRLPGMIFAFITAMFRAFYVGTTQTRTLTLNSIVMVLSNVIFNWILIFGHLGFPALGITGAAIGSSLAELISLIFFIVYTRALHQVHMYVLVDVAVLVLGRTIIFIPIYRLLANSLLP